MIRLPRRFHLVREVDVTGVSGTGVVAEGIEWTDLTVEIRWMVEGRPSSKVSWDNIGDAVSIHDHGNNSTHVRWLDAVEGRPTTYGDPYLSPHQTNPTAH